MPPKKRPPDSIAGPSRGRRRKNARYEPSYLRIRLPKNYTDLLEDLLLLDVNRVEYVQYNSNTNSYLYYICALILDVDVSDIALYRSISSEDADDEFDESWTKVTPTVEELRGGFYRCVPNTSNYS